MTVIRYPGQNGPEFYAPKRPAPEIPGGDLGGLDMRALESEIRKAAATGQRNEMGSGSDLTADSQNALIERVYGASAEEIDRVILELQGVRDTLRREGERVARGIADYTSLNQAVMSAMKLISKNLAQWRT
jgi:hypothetical protein